MGDIVSFNVRDGRTRRAIFEDAGLAAGWKDKVVTTEKKKHTITYDDLVTYGDSETALTALKVVFDRILSTENTIEGNTVITYAVDTVSPNPQTLVQAGKNALAKQFDKLDAKNAAEATTIRAATVEKADLGSKVVDVP